MSSSSVHTLLRLNGMKFPPKIDCSRHPFTISSSPDEDFMSVHIRIVGDWTGDLYNLLNPNKKPSGVIQKNMINAPNGKPIFLIDGPFGTASSDVCNGDKLRNDFVLSKGKED